MKSNEKWQYKNVLSTEWSTDQKAMDNPKFKTFAAYEKHTAALNKKFTNVPTVECRCLTNQ